MIKFLFVVLLPVVSFSSELDNKLDRYIDTFMYKPVKELRNTDKAKFRLGKKLFFDKRLSLRNDMACSTCHDPEFASGDSLPVSIGVGDHGIGLNRVQQNAHITRRSAPTIFNKGAEEFTLMFWDGRIFHSKETGEFFTPEPGLNGKNPKFSHITKVLDNALAAQALFPLTSGIEMKGMVNKDLSNIEVWNILTKKILAIKEYRDLFERTFKISLSKINIGHIANSIAYFEGREFQAANTPWDKYLRGNKEAMSDSEKRGAITFSDKARCARCHHGRHLTNFGFLNINVPQIESEDHKGPDLGRYEIADKPFWKYGFLTQPLRNVSKSAPYFHNGSMQTLEEVVDHYMNSVDSIYSYKVTNLNKYFSKNYLNSFSVINDSALLQDMQRNLHPLLRSSFSLTSSEKQDLLNFLEISLTEE